MKFYLKQKVFSWHDRFQVFDENGEVCFYVEGELFTLGKKLHIYDMSERELAYIQQKLLTFLPRYTISRDGQVAAEVQKHFTMFHQSYTIDGPGWEVEGDFWAHDYTISDALRTLVTINKRWMTWGDSYEIEIAPDVDVPLALAVVIVIDAVMDTNANA